MKKQDRQVYLSKYYKEVPANCVFNKVATGCGGTSLEIENMLRDSIITVPLEQMINNKVEQYPNERTPKDFKMFGVKAGITKEDVKEYLQANKVHKIIVTYDSLYKVIDAITELNQREIKNYFLLIDEVHYILNNYELRKEAVTKLLSFYKMFEKWCFMTATPNEEEFTLTELEGIRIEVAPFELEKVNIKNVRTVQVEATTKKLIEDYLENRLQNAHIFVNSIEIIASLIKACGLTNDNCKAVWSKGNKNYKRTIAGITRSEVGSKAKKINFYTSTCFEGSDILDEEGQYIIVSDGSKANTLNDISTSFRQILGRIRNTKYRSEAIHIFKKTKFSEISTFEAYKVNTEKTLRYAEQWIQLLIKEEIDEKEEIVNEKYITKVNGKYSIDKNLIKYDLLKYKLSMQTYSSIAIVKTELETNGFTTSNNYHFIEPSDFLKRNKDAKINFKDAFNEYSELSADIFTTLLNPISENRINLIEEAYPTIRNIYDSLGLEEVKKLGYNQNSIKRVLISQSDKTNRNKIAKILKLDGCNRNEFISSNDLKVKIERAYKLVKIDKTPKGKDIQTYFEAEPKKKNIDGIATQGYFILRDKFIFTESQVA
jgi:hypothetical protein